MPLSSGARPVETGTLDGDLIGDASVGSAVFADAAAAVREGSPAALVPAVLAAVGTLRAVEPPAVAADLGGDLGTGNAELVAVDAVVRVVRTDRTEAAEEAVCGGVGLVAVRGVAASDCALVRAKSSRGGPLICRLWRAGVGVGLLLSRARKFTRLPFSAAVGLRALALPGSGAVDGPETDLADRALVTDAVDAELLRRSLRRPDASTRAAAAALDSAGASARMVEGRDDVVERTLPASDSDMA